MSSASSATCPFRIGELAARTGASRRSLRYYESRGLLTSTRNAGGHRVFGPDAVGRVVRIQEMLAAGLSVAEIGELLPCLLAPPRQRTAVLAERLLAHRHRLDCTLARLVLARTVLDELIDGVEAPDARR